MISITSDIHHQGLETGNQRHSDITEVQTQLLCTGCLNSSILKQLISSQVRLLRSSGKSLKTFVTTRHLILEVTTTTVLSQNYFIELQINYLIVTMDPKVTSDGKQKTPTNHKERSEETVSFGEITYMHGKYTDDVLRACIKVCSDGVKKDSNGLDLVSSDYFHLPINIIPDHEHLIHAERNPRMD